MGELSTESTSLAISSSSSAHNWWDLHSTSWNPSVHTHNPWNSLNPSSNSPTCEEDVSISTSFTNGSNHSGVSVDSSHQFGESHELIGEIVSDNHMWNHVLLSSGGGDHGMMFQLPQNNNWEFSNTNYFDKTHHLNGFIHSDITSNENESNNSKNLSNLVSNWSIAPPCPQADHLDPQPYDNQGLFLHSGDTKSIRRDDSSGGLLQRLQAAAPSLDANYGASESCYYGGGLEDNNNGRKLCDVISFSGSSNGVKPSCQKSLNLSAGWRKQGLFTSNSPVKNSGRRQIINNEVKKRRSNSNSSETLPKKQKHESSAVSSVKIMAPKVKLGDKISALQQIVSPFGKTDTASVLLEAIGYIRFLQEQVQLLSNPYMKTMPCKDPWGALDRKEQGDAELDLQSRGLCLVPTSCTPQTYHENGVGSDYWTPTYRGCLYR
nr:transcription factor bHLH2 [Santalum album]